jgi:hypothetical protein
MARELVIYVADAGSAAKGNFHWVSSRDVAVSSPDPVGLARAIADDMKKGVPVALGYESPLFLPVEVEKNRLGCARNGETDPETGSRPFNAGAGASVLATGLQSLAWVLREIKRLERTATATTRWDAFRTGQYQLFVWEAFVSGSEKAYPSSHAGDAALAIAAFQQVMSGDTNPTRMPSASALSLAGAAVVWAGLSPDLSLLSEPCVVLRPLFPQDEARRRFDEYRGRQAKAKAEKASRRQSGE